MDKSAAEQYDSYKKQMDEVAEMSIQYVSDSRFQLSSRILSDLKLKIQNFGDKAFPLTEKQCALIEKAISEQREFALADRAARNAANEKERQMFQDREIKKVAEKELGIRLNGNCDKPAVYTAARDYYTRKISRFDAKCRIEADMQYDERAAAAAEIFGVDSETGYAHPSRAMFSPVEYQILRMKQDGEW